jgi:hypothetical protein
MKVDENIKMERNGNPKGTQKKDGRKTMKKQVKNKKVM